MSVDEIAKWVAIAKDAILGVAAIVTACAAVLGLNKWRAELTGKNQFEAARELMRATYRLRDAIHDCRAPYISAGEFPSGVADADGYAHVYRNRYRPVVEALQDFDARALEAEALWGTPIRSKADELRACVAELNAAIAALVDNERAQGQDFKSDPEFGKRVRSTVSWSGNGDFGKKISAAIGDVEREVRPHLKR